MDILAFGAKLFKEKFGLDIDSGLIMGALQTLLGDGQDGGNIAGLVSRFMSEGGLENIVGSWLGDGPNEALPVERIFSLFGSEKIAGFAQTLGLGEEKAAAGLAEVLPQMIDKISSGGSLIAGSADIDSVMSFARKLF